MISGLCSYISPESLASPDSDRKLQQLTLITLISSRLTLVNWLLRLFDKGLTICLEIFNVALSVQQEVATLAALSVHFYPKLLCTLINLGEESIQHSTDPLQMIPLNSMGFHQTCWHAHIYKTKKCDDCTQVDND